MTMPDEESHGAASLKGARVLLVDDDSFMRDFVQRALTKAGVAPVHVATDGKSALEMLDIYKDALDLVLLDIDMPELSGLHVLKEIRTNRDKAISCLRVVMLTGHSDLRNLRIAVTMGIHGFLAKPISPKALERRLSVAMTSERIPASALDAEYSDEKDDRRAKE